MSNNLVIRKLNDSFMMRWGALFIVAFTMMAAYFVNDVMSPLENILAQELSWSSADFGMFTGSYSWLNVFLLMLLWGGLILDRFGVRFTGKLATILMVAGTGLVYYAITSLSGSETLLLGKKIDVMVASIGFSVFGVGAEVAGITVTKVIAKWFKGKEMATAMGMQVALARLGTQAAFSFSIPIAGTSHNISLSLLVGLLALLIGMVAFFLFSFLDKKLDRQIVAEKEDDKETFSFKDVKSILTSPGFWLIALLCVLFYSCVFPFQKFATALLIDKYSISETLAGTIAGMPALGALVLTPIFGSLVDRRGKAASIMALGAAMLIFVHLTYALPFVTSGAVAIGLMVVLGIAFSLVPSAMWPSVAKIFPAHQLGTAYALIFLIQNIGLWGVPTLIGWVKKTYCVTGAKPDGTNTYDYTILMVIFTAIAAVSLLMAIMLRIVDRRLKYRLEEPNLKK